MKNSNAKETPAQGVEVSKGKKNTDTINIDKVKVNLKKADKSVSLDKTAVQASKSLYKGTDGMKGEDHKKFRSKIRRGLHSFCNQILGKDRSEEERKASVKSFLSFYKINWRVQDFKIESFTQSKDEADLKDYKDLLKFVASSLEKGK